ncbi:MAG: DUF3149 domain-containing protein [Pseudomonadota bacterium]|nr:DUF3149 domain-containing protein [Sulfuricystis thermophila]MDI6750574.1 DUF3149 domain-containing protein [Rhodocyclaceae bacterium]
MQALKELFSTDIGLLSTFTVAFAIGMIIFIYNFAKKHMDEDARNASRK